MLWYVAYGSNLSRARFLDYVAEPGVDRPLTIEHPLWFGGESTIWTGGRAYLDHAAEPGCVTYARAWLLDEDQWDHLHARENAGGNYAHLLDLGEHEGVPARTFTVDRRRDPAAYTRPSVDYLRTIATGLSEAHGLDAAEAAAYLSGCVAGHWTEPELRAALGA